jgi:AraC family transcriptional regulator, dual regulator of chb operon
MDHLNYIDIFDLGASFFIADTVFPDNRQTGIHTHDFHEFFVVRQGELIHYHNDEKYIMKPGEICFVHADDHHYFQATPGGAPAIITNMAFTSLELQLATQYLQCMDIKDLPARDRLVLPDNHSFSALLLGMTTLFKLDSPGNPGALSLFRALLVQALVRLHDKGKQPKETLPRWLSVACMQMEKPENYREGIQQFVKLSGKTQEHLTRSLRKFLNLTPSEYINNIRLLEAARQLRNTSKPVSDIGYETGFENASWFNRLFKARFGQSPGKYRQLNLSIVNPIPRPGP